MGKFNRLILVTSYINSLTENILTSNELGLGCPQKEGANFPQNMVKGIVHFEINFWYVLAYLKCIQDVGVYLPFLSVSHIMEVYGVHLKEHAQRSPN